MNNKRTEASPDDRARSIRSMACEPGIAFFSPLTLRVSDELLLTDDALKRALVGLERANMAREVHYAWSSITECNTRIAKYLTGGFPALSGGSLLVKTLDSAFRAYASADPRQRMAPLHAYFTSVMDSLQEVFRYSVFGKDARGRTRRWKTFSVSLVDFVSTNAAVELIWYADQPNDRLDEQLRRGIIAGCVLSYDDLVSLNPDAIRYR